jgi:hypothetical protein
MKKANTGVTNLSNLSKLAFALPPISSAERARRRNNRLRAAAQRQSSVRASAKRNKTPSPPKRKNSPKRNKTPSPRVTIGARVPIARRVVTLPNGTKQTQYFITNEYYLVGPNGRYNFTKPVKR